VTIIFPKGVTVATVPTLADVKTYLGNGATRWSDAELTDTLNGEIDAQAAVCRTANYTASLRQALLRRVSRALAMKGLPLAMTQGDGDAGPTSVPGRDPEIRRLEAPYRRLTVG
jgi:hypothetical protein